MWHTTSVAVDTNNVSSGLSSSALASGFSLLADEDVKEAPSVAAAEGCWSPPEEAVDELTELSVWRVEFCSDRGTSLKVEPEMAPEQATLDLDGSTLLEAGLLSDTGSSSWDDVLTSSTHATCGASSASEIK